MKSSDTIQELEELIKRYQHSYYSGASEITDAEFDQLWDRLKRLRPESPALQRVGAEAEFSNAGLGLPMPPPAAAAPVSAAAANMSAAAANMSAAADGFPKAAHLMPMGSQEKAANAAEFHAWAAKTGLTRFAVEHKLDGVSLELQYRQGVLVRAVTRGDGAIGDDISANARKVKGVAEQLPCKDFSGGVRGEVIIPRAAGESLYPLTNWRNVANGLMHRLDGAGCENLCFISYDAAKTGDPFFFQTETGKIEWLKRQGFDTTPVEEIAGADEVVLFRDKTAAGRAGIPYNIDGLVVKDIVTDSEDLKENRPKKQIAFKFPVYRAVTVLRNVEWSRNGATYTPVALFDEVRLHDTNVKQATLHNIRTIRGLGLKIGSLVIVVKRGEIIPKIEGLAAETDILDPEVIRAQVLRGGGAAERARNQIVQEIEMPAVCETCGTALVDAETRLYCPNKACKKRLLHRLEKWVSMVDMREMGEKLLSQLVETGRLRSVADFYTLTEHELSGYERMGALSAAKVMRHILTPKTVTLARFVAGFDFEGVGELIMEKVSAAGFDTLEKLRAAAGAELASVYGLGEITAGVIREGLTESAGDMDAVLEAGVISIARNLAALPLSGVSFCFTGELRTLKRPEAEARVKALGGSVKSSVVKGLSFLVTNEPLSNSSKNKKAAALHIQVIDEAAFLQKTAS